MYALAIDLGTTTLAASLLDRASGERLAFAGTLNPQRGFGADVVARLDAALGSASSYETMTALIRDGLRRLGLELCASAGVAWDDVSHVAIAGNPAMQHILLGLDLRPLAFPPYRPVRTEGTHVPAAGLGWAGSAEVYVFPAPGGFVGGDTVAFLYGLSPSPFTPALCLDMGTNGEIALVAGETVWATSAAAGPAFEGGNISCGMAALPGAISSVQIDGDRLTLQVVGGGRPSGICGSGVIEAVAELLRYDIINASGRLRNPGEIDSNLASRVIGHDDSLAFVLYRDAERLITLTQDDIRQLQLAKAALRAGIDVLAERSCIRCDALQQVILTGSFGAVLNPGWLKTIGIFDESMVQTTRFTPEGALAGAERAVAAVGSYHEVEALARRFQVVPLSGTPLFETLFMRHIDFPLMHLR
jgi:uncharacterized 2Fe-2S/4Fe-4S cluster protein (DUF4445 family)